LGVAQIVQGLPHQIDNIVQGKGSELRPIENNPAYRVLDAAYLAGLALNARDVVNAFRFKAVSRTGGFVDGRAPRFIRELEARDSLGQGQTLMLSADGDLYLKRSGPDGIYLIRWMVRLSETQCRPRPVAAVALDGPADAVRSVYRFARCGESRAAQSNRRARNFSAQAEGQRTCNVYARKRDSDYSGGLTWAVY